MKAVVAVVETLSPLLDPENMANLIEWVAANANERTELFAGKLDIDTELLKTHLEEQKEHEEEVDLQPSAAQESKPRPFAAAS